MTKIDYEMTNFVYEMLKRVKAKRFTKNDAINSINRIVPVLRGKMGSIDTDIALLLVWFGSFCVKFLNGAVIEKEPNIDDFFEIAQKVDYEDFYDVLNKIFKTYVIIRQQHREI